MNDLTAVSLAAAIEQASALLPTDPAEAERRAEAMLRSAPRDPRAGLILGSARRRQGALAAAKSVLAPLARAYPNAAMTQYELGVTLIGLGETAAGEAALRRAVSLKRDLPEAWQALGDLLFRRGDVVDAEAAFAEQNCAFWTHPVLKAAADALAIQRLDDAERLLRQHLAQQPDDAIALRLLAEVFLKVDRNAEAEMLAARALELDPVFDGARFTLAEALFRRQKGAPALAMIEQLLRRDPTSAAYRNLTAACLSLLSEYPRAIALYEGLLDEFPGHPQIWLNYGQALRTTGRREEAVTAFRRAIGLASTLGEAYWSLANLKVATFSRAEIEAMGALLERTDLSDADRVHLNYALGKALEDAGEPQAAFANYSAGGALRRGALSYDAGATTAMTGRLSQLLTQEFLAEREGQGATSDAPIFVLGLPRSGSTLVEQILASHSMVEGTMELPDIGLMVQDLALAGQRLGSGYPGVIRALTTADLALLGQRYLANTEPHRKLGRPFFIDKMPNNFQHIGLIRLILPNARIIDARRHPMATCFSAFKQHFAQGQAFSYDLTDLGRYYRDYVDLMAHFDAVMPGKVHRVIYEDLVEDTEGQVRTLLDYCGLPFEAACLEFHKNDRAVRTVSSEQVRRPIFRDGLDQWRQFEPWLGPLKEALGPALDNWRVAPLQ